MANGFENLSPKVKIKWLVKHLIAAFILMAFSYFARGPIEDFLSLEHNTLMKISFLLSVIIIVGGAAFNELYYMHYIYRLGSTDMIIKRGFIRKHEDIVPYEKIQNVSIEMGIISRLLGIATIRVETAGTNVMAAELEIPGIENAHDFGKMLINKVETIKHSTEAGNHNPQAESVGIDHVEPINEDLQHVEKLKKEFTSKLNLLEKELEEKDKKIFNMENSISNLLDKLKFLEMKEQQQKSAVLSSVAHVPPKPGPKKQKPYSFKKPQKTKPNLPAKAEKKQAKKPQRKK